MTNRPIREDLRAAYGADDAARVGPRVQRTLAERQRARMRAAHRWRLAAIASAVLGVTSGTLVWAFTRAPERHASSAEPATATRKATAKARPPGPLMLADGSAFRGAEPEARDRVVALHDGSRINLRGSTRLEVLENTGSRIALIMSDGRATFDVRPGGPRAWSIDAGSVLVDVLGTRFTIDRGAASTRVEVERGLVRVRGARVPDGVRRVSAGEHIEVSLEPTAARSEPPEQAVPPPALGRARQQASRGDEWRALAARGEFERAYAALGPEQLARELRSAPDVESLLALADTARLSGHAADAVQPLHEIISQHADDSRAAVAAFTLGRLYLESLGRPADATASFERAIEAPPAGRARRAGVSSARRSSGAARRPSRRGDDRAPLRCALPGRPAARADREPARAALKEGAWCSEHAPAARAAWSGTWTGEATGVVGYGPHAERSWPLRLTLHADGASLDGEVCVVGCAAIDEGRSAGGLAELRVGERRFVLEHDANSIRGFTEPGGVPNERFSVWLHRASAD